MSRKRLLIMRHAKSSWQEPELDDFQRPLIPKGIKRTARVSEALKKNNFIPEQIISSSAVRALSTAKLITQNLNLPEDIIIKESHLYFQGDEEYFNTVFSCSNDIKTLMIVGHNPIITLFSNYFLTEKIENMPTSGIIGLDFETDKWENIIGANCHNIIRYFPKEMKK